VYTIPGDLSHLLSHYRLYLADMNARGRSPRAVKFEIAGSMGIGLAHTSCSGWHSGHSDRTGTASFGEVWPEGVSTFPSVQTQGR